MSLSVERAYSASEIIAQEEALERAAASAASARCTYSLATPAAAVGILGTTGPVFSCRTCAASAGRPIGVCEACTLNCHTDHDIVEVGSRNHHRCDCPTLSHQECACAPAGAPSSCAQPAASNVYGHNFEDRFCSCDRAYEAAADTMHQCVACGEWYHDHHVLGMIPGGIVDIEALVCARCVSALPFLRSFARFTPGACANVLHGVAPGTGLGGACAPPQAPLSVPPPTSDALLAEGGVGAAEITHGGASRAGSPVLDGSRAGSPLPDGSRTGSPVPDGGGSACVIDTPYNFEPWVCCLTCTAGADDGVSVCLGCAASCHAGHVLTPPRLSDFACDCSHLGGGCGLLALPNASQVVRNAVTAQDGAEEGDVGVRAKRARVDDALAGGVGGGEPLKKEAEKESAAPDAAALVHTPLAAWCAASPVTHALPAGDVAVGGRDGPPPMLLGSLDSLTARLCKCDTCKEVLMRARVGTWFWGEKEDLIVADDCEGVLAGSVVHDAGAGVGAAVPGFKTSYDRGLEALGAMPTTMQVDMLRGYRAFWEGVLRRAPTSPYTGITTPPLTDPQPPFLLHSHTEELSTAFRNWLAREQADGKSVISKEDIGAFMRKFKAEQEELKASSAAGGGY